MWSSRGTRRPARRSRGTEVRSTLAAALTIAAATVASPQPGEAEQALPELIFTAQTGFQPLPCECPENPLGGWAQRLAVLDSIRADARTPLLLDAGGWLSGEETPAIARLVADVHARMGYDAINLGDTELALLGETFPAWARALPLVSGHPQRPPGVPAYRIFERDGLSVAVIGTAVYSTTDLTPAEQVGRTLAGLPRTDAVVVLLSGGFGPMNLIANVHDRVNVVLYADGARTETPIRRRVTTGAAPGAQGRYVGRLDVPHVGADASECRLELIPVEPHRRSTVDVMRLALEAAELHEGPEALVERLFVYR